MTTEIHNTIYTQLNRATNLLTFANERNVYIFLCVAHYGALSVHSLQEKNKDGEQKRANINRSKRLHNMNECEKQHLNSQIETKTKTNRTIKIHC